MTIDDAMHLIEMLAAAFPKQRLDERNIAVYARMIEDFDRVEAEAAILHLMATATFFPAIAEVRAAIAEGRTILPIWEDAWDQLITIRKRHGSYVGPRWGNQIGWDDLTDQALRIIGGYESFCAVSFADEGTMRAQFRDAYTNLRKKRIQVEATSGLDRIGSNGVAALNGGAL